MAYSKKEREQYNIDRVITCEKLQIRELDYNTFRRLGQALRKQFENRCNTDISDETYESLVNPLYETAEGLAKRFGLYIYFQTDPRGASIYLSREPIPENNYTTASVIY